ncbi:hypothetical protein EVAR_100750_1 [Eumeta japonica]|uniref:Uncharacterized protein n=1 Tax=Eumeta variegata TaxID=151549 RepID=A0A4C1ZBD9_EUMVA|nr:hypothetical protein EVAR_100750_1 [Eumeta japonica]
MGEDVWRAYEGFACVPVSECSRPGVIVGVCLVAVCAAPVIQQAERAPGGRPSELPPIEIQRFREPIILTVPFTAICS